ncbi:lipopolysaccharide transport periplasmic protein LptA [Luteimonas arsenica]|uniref:lipopolysaccharide transport periplasmic protein LptA n=1 Tax=Luteimonas arsenica TaxID=1586242 RepID=UPI00105482DE|nr:lipopolysaccharide transport periplasmic protein LptA [Luteimonas arsenica]
MSPRAASLTTVLTLAAALAAAPAWAKSSDRNQPMDLTSNTQDCMLADDGGPCVFTGNVRIVQGTLDVRAAKADVRRGGGDIQRVVLTGSPVRLKQQLDDGGTIDATANTVDYDLQTETVVFTGNAEINQPGRGTMAGGRIVYNMATGRVQGGGQDGGQIRTRILPKGAKADQGGN